MHATCQLASEYCINVLDIWAFNLDVHVVDLESCDDYLWRAGAIMMIRVCTTVVHMRSYRSKTC